MSKFFPEIRLIKFEGFDTFIQCDLFLNTQKLETLYPCRPGNHFHLTSTDPYTLLLQTNKSTYSVSFTSSLFSSEGMIWVPLSHSPNFLQVLPEETQVPRLLILSKQIEVDAEEEFETFMPQLSLFGTTVEDSVFSEKPENVECGPSDNELVIHAAICMQNSMEVEQTRTLHVIEVLGEKEIEFNKALVEINTLKNRINRLESENLSLRTAGLFYHQSQNLLNEINSIKVALSEISENTKKRKSRATAAKALDQAIYKECIKLGVKAPEKDTEEVFQINKTKLNLFLDSGQLIYRSGSAAKTFSSFHSSSSAFLIKPLHELSSDIHPSQFLEFEYTPDQISTTILRLKNIHTSPLCFKVKTTAPKCYVVKPSIGYLDIAESKELIITIQPGIDTSAQLNHKFSIQTAPTQFESPTLDWITKFWASIPPNSQDARLSVRILDLSTFKSNHSFASAVGEGKMDRPESVKLEIKDLKDFQEKQERVKEKMEEEYAELVAMMKKREEEIVKCEEEGMKGFGSVHMMLACFVGVFVGYLYAVISS